MPELPEVETVRMGLEPVLVGNRFASVEQRRKDLRFPLPVNFAQRLSGRKVEALDRRAKYLLARLDDGEVLVMHLGMTGRFSIDHANGEHIEPGEFYEDAPIAPTHEHIVFHMGDGAAVRYADARRFGYMDLIRQSGLDEHALFKGLGIEPLSEGFTSEWLANRLQGKATSIKAALLDQRLIAGIGNIYACEALHRARISPLRLAGTIATKSGKPTPKIKALVDSIKAVLGRAIKAGGSSLRDYRSAEGRLGRFQHSFKVYGREGKPCRGKGCSGTVRRIVQNGRSTFYCPTCQK
jgi:formamidopyrimidine-DNA glycosylase